MCREAPTSPLSSAAEAGTCVGKLLFLPLSSDAGAGTGDVNFNNTPTVGLSGIISQNGMSIAAARAVLARDFGLGGPRGRDQEMFNHFLFFLFLLTISSQLLLGIEMSFLEWNRCDMLIIFGTIHMVFLSFYCFRRSVDKVND